jgi:hypothetical protein
MRNSSAAIREKLLKIKQDREDLNLSAIKIMSSLGHYSSTKIPVKAIRDPNHDPYDYSLTAQK